MCSGAWVEDKKIALTYHYKGVNDKLRAKLIEDAKKIIKSHGFQIIDAHYAIEGKPPVNWDKGKIVKNIPPPPPSFSENVKICRNLKIIEKCEHLFDTTIIDINLAFKKDT